ncbi:MAG TPA: DUF3179 domain-containing (seleno)protein [Chthonomonadaceae bacterium]|nr:DUF3179 domain-containing (seleno)protein [Chthonomonadaceae bacterium]
MRVVMWLVWMTALINGILFVPAVTQSQVQEGAKSAIASDINPKALWDGRKTVEFHAMNQPKMVKAADAHFLIDDEYVLGITSHGESRAYPTRFVSWHHIINDKIGTPENGGPSFVTITYCIVCDSGICFETPIVQGRPLTFDFYGLYNGVMTMYDLNTKSVWLQVSGRAVKGPLLDSTLKSGPLLDTTWGQWKKLHPDTLVMAPDPHFKDCYEPKGSIMIRGYSSFPADYFRKTLTRRDTRLPMFEPVLAVTLPAMEDAPSSANAHAQYRAYPVKAFKSKTRVINDTLGVTPVAVLFMADTETLTAVKRVVEGQTLTLEVRNNPQGKPAFYDKETGTRWNLEGRAIEGPLAGKELLRLDSHRSQWYGWVSYFPRTTIYGQSSDMVQASLK